MKRFLVFAGSDYYPRGPEDDFQMDFETFDTAKTVGEALLENHDWVEILDTAAGVWHSKTNFRDWRGSEAKPLLS